MVQHDDQSTGPNYVEETLSYIALHSWYDVHTAKEFTLLSVASKLQSTRRVPPLRLQTIQFEHFIILVS